MPIPRPRPLPGTTTTREVRHAVCRHCGYMIDEGGLCWCTHDGEEDLIFAVYRVTEIFLRDEMPGTANAKPSEAAQFAGGKE